MLLNPKKQLRRCSGTKMANTLCTHCIFVLVNTLRIEDMTQKLAERISTKGGGIKYRLDPSAEVHLEHPGKEEMVQDSSKT